MTKNAGTLFDMWVDLSYLHWRWIGGKIDSAEFSEALQRLLKELKSKAEEPKAKEAEVER